MVIEHTPTFCTSYNGKVPKYQWIAAIKELEEKETIIVPSTFLPELEKPEVSHRWASGPSLDGEGHFQYVEKPIPLASKPVLNPAPSYIHDTLPSVINRDDIPPQMLILIM